MTMRSRTWPRASASIVSPLPLPYVSAVSKKVTPRSYARRKRSIPCRSSSTPHQLVLTVQRPNPTVDSWRPVLPSLRYFMPALVECAGFASTAYYSGRVHQTQHGGNAPDALNVFGNKGRASGISLKSVTEEFPHETR